MGVANLGQLVADVWEQTLRESEDPFSFMLDERRWNYRQWLDRPIINRWGERVPQLAIVRRHLRALGKPKTPPRLPR